MVKRGAIHFGVGISEKTGEIVKSEGCKKVILLTDKGVVGAGISAKIEKSLEKSGIEYVTFDKIEADAPGEIIEACVETARSNNVDGIVGVGGGSVLDSSKATECLLSNPGKLTDFFDNPPTEHLYPLFLLSTTSGTGADLTSSSVIHDPTTNRKRSLPGAAGCADHSIIDPELTLGCPKSVTLFCGMDVLGHALAMYTQKNIPEYADPSLETVFKRVADYLRRAVDDGSDLEARVQMSYACMIAGMTMKDVKCHLDHMIAQEAAPMAHLPHGLLVALAMPVTLKYVTRAYPERVKRIMTYLGFVYPDNMSSEEIGEKAYADMKKWLRSFGINDFSSYYKMTEKDMATFKKNCQAVACWGNQPFEYDDKDLDDILALYTE